MDDGPYTVVDVVRYVRSALYVFTALPETAPSGSREGGKSVRHVPINRSSPVPASGVGPASMGASAGTPPSGDVIELSGGDIALSPDTSTPLSGLWGASPHAPANVTTRHAMSR